MLQQLQNLTSDDIIHGYQTCLLIESFFRGQVFERMSFAVSQIEDCLELNFRYNTLFLLLSHSLLQEFDLFSLNFQDFSPKMA